MGRLQRSATTRHIPSPADSSGKMFIPLRLRLMVAENACSDAAQELRLDDLAVVPFRISFECRPHTLVPTVCLRVFRVRVIHLSVGEDADHEIFARPPL